MDGPATPSEGGSVDRVPVVLLSGTVGAGKTALLHELSDLLADAGLAHLALDVDAVSYTYPRPAADPHGQQVALENLSLVWDSARRRGAERVLLARAVEASSDLDGYRAAIPGADITLCRVVASPEVVAQRLRGREVGSALEWHLRRAPELDGILDRAALEDMTVVNDRPLSEVAAEVAIRLGWLPKRPESPE